MPDINDAAERVPMIVPSITDNDRSSVERVRAGISGTGNYLSPLLIHKCDLQSLVKIADFALSQLAERDETNRLLKECYDHSLLDDEGERLPHKDACYCTDTGCGEYVNGVLTGDLLECLPCKLARALNINTDAGAK